LRRSYLDTSALRHLLVRHAATDAVRELLGAGTIAATSQVTVTELLRVAGRIPGVSLQHVDAVLANVDLILLTQDQSRAAGLLPDLPSGAQLRSLDALHLHGATEFVTSDRRQGEAASGVGLSVTHL
jgi:predicted nucleic acid-binding protein